MDFHTHITEEAWKEGGLDGEEYNAIKKCISTTSITSYLATRLASISHTTQKVGGHPKPAFP